MKLWNWLAGKKPEPKQPTGGDQRAAAGTSGRAAELRCSTCGSTYRLADDATIVTVQDFFNLLRSHGGTVVGETRSTFATQTDPALIGRTANMDHATRAEVLEKVASIRATLRKGGKAFWYCEKCKNSKQPHLFPGDF